MSRHKRLRFTVLRLIRVLPVVSVIVITAAGNAFSQTPVLSSTPEFADLAKLIREGRNEQVFEELKQTVKNNELSAGAWYLLGIAYLQHNDFKKSSSAFNRAIELQPDLAASAKAQFAYAQVLRNKLKIALPSVENALEIDPNNIDALYAMAALDLRIRGRDDAVKHADAIIAQKPDLAEAYLLKSTALLGFKGNVISIQDETKQERVQRYQAATNALEQYLKLANDPRATQAWGEQLESLKFYASQELAGRESPEVYSVRELTTKPRLIEKPEPSFTDAATAEQVAGTVVVRCVFGGDGTIQHVLVLQSLTHGLTEASVAAVKRIKFEPATVNGKPVSTFMQLEYNFQLY